MGSYISVGLVYKKDKHIQSELMNLTDNLLKIYNGQIIRVEYSEDNKGEKWIQQEISINDHIDSLYNKLIENNFGTVLIGIVFSGKDTNVMTRIEQQKSYFGFLIDFNEEDITTSKEDLEEITDELVSFITQLYEFTKYDYAFCDHEAEMDNSLDLIETSKEEIYSILIKPINNKNENSFSVIKNNWHIDGLTERNLL